MTKPTTTRKAGTLPNIHASRLSGSTQIKVRLDANAQRRIIALQASTERLTGYRPSASIVVRLALRAAAELFSNDPVGDAAPGHDLISVIRAAAKGR